MIRRNDPLHDGVSWLVITQQDHARLSHAIASAWRMPTGGGLLGDLHKSVREQLLETIDHHDDGWQAWDARPPIDPQKGWPYGFTEMPSGEAQAIWSQSITLCRELGPLPGWLAASHFIELQSPRDENFHEWSAWLTEQDQHRDGWLEEWQSQDASRNETLARECLYYLRTFDWISLWLCCRAPHVAASVPKSMASTIESLTLHEPKYDFGPYQMTPTETVEEGCQLVVDPWPFEEPHLELEVPARRIPTAEYRTTELLLAAGEADQLTWRLIPKPQSLAFGPSTKAQ